MTKILVISMDTELGRTRRTRLNYEYEWLRGCTFDDSSKEVQTKMRTIPQCPESKKKTRIGVFEAHLRALRHVVENEIDDVIICEDDAILHTSIPDSLPMDAATLLGGVVGHPTSWDKHKRWLKEDAPKVLASFKPGINRIDYDQFRWYGAWAIYYPTHTVAQSALKAVTKCKFYKGFDSLLSKLRLVHYLYYPSVFDHNDQGVSQNGGGSIELIRDYVEPRRRKF